METSEQLAWQKIETDNQAGKLLHEDAYDPKANTFQSRAKAGAESGALLSIIESLFESSKQDHLSALPSDADLYTAKKFFKQNGTTGQSDLAELCQKKEVCGIGENHTSLGAKDYMAQNIEALAKQGYKFVGFEMVRQSNQALLDGYMKGSVSAAELIIRGSFRGYDYTPGAPERYLKILDAMKEYNQRTGANIRPIALEIDYSGFAFNERDAAWAKKVDEVLKDNPGQKMAIYAGAAHLGIRKDYSSVNQELQKLGHDSAAISLDFHNPQESAVLKSERAARSAREQGANSPFAYTVEADEQGEKRADSAVYIPMVELAHPDFGIDVTTPEDRGKSRTGAISLPRIDPDGKLLVKTDKDGCLISLAYQAGQSSDEIKLQKNREFEKYETGKWIHENNEGSEDLIYDRDPAWLVITIREGKLLQVRQNSLHDSTLLYPPLQ